MATTAPAGDRQQDLELITVNGVRIACTDTGGPGVPLVLVHGSWGSHHNWDMVVPGLAEHFRVVTYDRRGHSESERPSGQGHFSEDVADLAALVEQRGIARAWVAGSSAGAVITLQLATARPDLLRGMVVHEPPLFGVLAEGSVEARVSAALRTGPLGQVAHRIAAGDHAGAAQLFVEEVALGPGRWSRLPDEMRATFIHNAPTYLDELNDPECTSIDEARIAGYDGPVLLTAGDQSPPIFTMVERRLAELLPQAERATFTGAGHIPHVTHPAAYVAELLAFVQSSEGRQ